MYTELNKFVVADSQKCIGCRLCEVACSLAHTESTAQHPVAGQCCEPLFPRLYLVHTEGVTTPVQCRHCEDAPCAGSCPVAAIRRVDGALVVDEKLCVGCKTCMLACPFGAIELLPVYENGEPKMQLVAVEDGTEATGEELSQVLVAGKCDLCFQHDGGPACVTTCPEQALQLVDAAALRKKRSAEAALNLSKYVQSLGATQTGQTK
ncbi:MAG: 4Fe-4S dicluster domain-containing protein [Desulfovibrio sp.]